MVKSKGTLARKPACEPRVCATALLAMARARTKRTTAKFFIVWCLPFRGIGGPVAAAGTGARHTSGLTVDPSGGRTFAPPQELCKQIVTNAGDARDCAGAPRRRLFRAFQGPETPAQRSYCAASSASSFFLRWIPQR